jgi:hypothetical protein
MPNPILGNGQKGFYQSIIYDELVKTSKLLANVIPAKAGIQ